MLKPPDSQFIGDITIYKHCLCFVIQIVTSETKESFVTRTNTPVVETLLSIGDVSVSIAISVYQLNITHYNEHYCAGVTIRAIEWARYFPLVRIALWCLQRVRKIYEHA